MGRHDPLPAGDYQAILYDANWRPLQAKAFSVAALSPRAPAQPTPPPPPGLQFPLQTQTPRPQLRLTGVTADGPAYAGESLTFHVTAVNQGAVGSGGSISVSSPDMALQAIDVVGCDMRHTLSTKLQGEQITSFSAAPFKFVPARYQLAEVQFSVNDTAMPWPSGGRCELVVRGLLPASGAAAIYLRTTAFAGDSSIETWPLRGSGDGNDQQGLPAAIWRISVVQR